MFFEEGAKFNKDQNSREEEAHNMNKKLMALEIRLKEEQLNEKNIKKMIRGQILKLKGDFYAKRLLYSNYGTGCLSTNPTFAI